MAVAKIKRVRMRFKGLSGRMPKHAKKRLKKVLSTLFVTIYNYSKEPTHKARIKEAHTDVQYVLKAMVASTQKILQIEKERQENYAKLKAEFDAARAAGRTFDGPEQRATGG